ncbi:ATP-binding protein [Hahella sp. CCB-MM4]|uniref:sensor histidine kinase n=1 Tax=Hahella sp. (strain CCB-MM4) TaxID=1926491 RepID=UPI000B9A2B4B|nr:HAMP domain-containing sensor histidine kinase [Hahella sp. CCB-MM4]OZG70984.1 ATP-binding protein [Hahella sp. CCB-MM4]
MSDNSNPLDFNFIMASSVHDMKNSLSMLLHSLDEVSQEVNELQLPVADRMATLQYEAARVNNDLVQLLSLYKLENEALRPHIDEHFLRDFLEEHIARYHPLFKVKDMRCELVCDETLSGYFDRDLISGVINNTLANAIRYSHDAIRVSAFKEEDGLSIMIEDDGAGFPTVMLEQPGKLTEGVNFESGSTHLGLYFAHRIATLHTQNGKTGTIKLSNDSKLGGGTFKLYLP